MIKRTLYFENPAYLSLKLGQLVVNKPAKGSDVVESPRTIPIEDIGVIVLDNKQITITQVLMEALLENNCALITCDASHLPVGLMLPLCGNTIQNERFRHQIASSLPLRKKLWQQTVQQKVRNQAAVLEYATGERHDNMYIWADSVKSGDTDNVEARAAAYYWKQLFPMINDFTRAQEGVPPNNLLNYGYAILRAIIARALVGSGLLPTLGIHHHNRYNAYCLADDIMEPYRPYIDKMVYDIVKDGSLLELSTNMKVKFLEIPVMDVIISGHKSPLMVAATASSSSLIKCYLGKLRKISYPEIIL